MGRWWLEQAHCYHHALAPSPSLSPSATTVQGKNKRRHQEDSFLAGISLPRQKIPWDCAKHLPHYVQNGKVGGGCVLILGVQHLHSGSLVSWQLLL